MNSLYQARQYEKENRTDPKKQPAFHLCPPVGWMNDPNGFSFYNGQAHLFYQYHPYSLNWGPMYWGHQVSDDLIAWKLKPCALAPEDPSDLKGCFSGTALCEDGKHILVYTGVSEKDGAEVQNQCLAIGDGTDYAKPFSAPIIDGSQLPPGFSRLDFRDPKIWKQSGRYHLIAGSLDENKEGQIVHFTSDNLKNWQYEGVLLHATQNQGRMWECPDLFQIGDQDVLVLSPQDMKENGRGIHNGHNATVFIGRFNGNTFEPQSEMLPLDYGFDFYAPQTFTHPDGRQIMIGWMSSWHAPIAAEGQSWSSQMTLPRELSIQDGKLIQKPVRELASYWKNTLCLDNQEIEGTKEIKGVRGRYTDFTLTFKKPLTGRFAIDLAAGSKNCTTFEIDPGRGRMEMDRRRSGPRHDLVSLRRAPLPAKGISQLRIILDLYSIEIFINDGEMVLSTVIPTEASCDEIRFSSNTPQAFDLEFHEIDAGAIRTKRME